MAQYQIWAYHLDVTVTGTIATLPDGWEPFGLGQKTGNDFVIMLRQVLNNPPAEVTDAES